MEKFEYFGKPKSIKFIAYLDYREHFIAQSLKERKSEIAKSIRIKQNILKYSSLFLILLCEV